ncbi:ubiquitin-protein ligase E3 C [Syncephalis fuscata]|nr:ubiquitin-protein ligase E3 C [Syncephalis fuscata]
MWSRSCRLLQVGNGYSCRYYHSYQRQHRVSNAPLSRLSPAIAATINRDIARPSTALLSAKGQTRGIIDVAFHLLHGSDHPSAPRSKPVPNYPRITAIEAAKHRTPPRKCSMLARDFVDDSLYNPHYGYFSKQATIFTVSDDDQGFDFGTCKDQLEFMNCIGARYAEIEGELNDVNDIMRQVWHTPTELFKPWYGYAIAKYLVAEYKLNGFPSEDLNIYEMGAGNGTLMLNILDYIREHEPSVYERTQYYIIEISSKLAEQQTQQHQIRDTQNAHHGRVHIINRSIFDWDQRVTHPCFFIAMEVIDNFAHDIVRYEVTTGRPMQAVVHTDGHGDYEEVYEPVTDPLIQRYLTLRRRAGHRSNVLQQLPLYRFRQHFPLAPNLTSAEFLPTKALLLLERLRDYFPQHRLILSDFYQLPDAMPGQDAPVVQTRYQHTMVPCSTYMVQPGWFDIFYPTNFELLRDVYQLICRSDHAAFGPRVLGEREFLVHFADIEQTRTLSGENPMLDYYENNKFLFS